MEYKYAVLRHQPSLQKSERENFAVIVEGKLASGGVMFAVGRSPAPSTAISELGRSVAESLPEVIDRAIAEAVHKRRADQDTFAVLGEALAWNFHMSSPQTVEDNDPIHRVAYKLFSEHVAGADQLIEILQNASKRMLRPPETKQWLGATFQTAVSVPEPEYSVAAD